MHHNVVYTPQYQAMTSSISVNYALIWRFKHAPQYQVSRCKKIFNTQTGKQIKMCLNGRSIGFWIAGNWVATSKINSMLEKIPERACRF